MAVVVLAGVVFFSVFDLSDLAVFIGSVFFVDFFTGLVALFLGVSVLDLGAVFFAVVACFLVVVVFLVASFFAVVVFLVASFLVVLAFVLVVLVEVAFFFLLVVVWADKGVTNVHSANVNKVNNFISVSRYYKKAHFQTIY